jgi:NTP pyrophosphatase (non-canonical NTP hydrolase)
MIERLNRKFVRQEDLDENLNTIIKSLQEEIKEIKEKLPKNISAETFKESIDTV